MSSAAAMIARSTASRAGDGGPKRAAMSTLGIMDGISWECGRPPRRAFGTELHDFPPFGNRRGFISPIA